MRGLNLRRAGRSAKRWRSSDAPAHEVAPSPRTLGQMGLVESSLQLWADAEAHLVAALATPSDAWVHRNRQFLDQARERTREHMGELVITGPTGTKVSLGEKAIGRSRWRRPFAWSKERSRSTPRLTATSRSPWTSRSRAARGRPSDRARTNRSGGPQFRGSGGRGDRSAAQNWRPLGRGRPSQSREPGPSSGGSPGSRWSHRRLRRRPAGRLRDHLRHEKTGDICSLPEGVHWRWREASCSIRAFI